MVYLQSIVELKLRLNVACISNVYCQVVGIYSVYIHLQNRNFTRLSNFGEFTYMMAAKELKALVDIGTSLGYTGEDLKQWLNDERMRIDREKERRQEEKRQEEEKQRQEEEKKRQEEEKKRAFELEKLKIEAEAERAKIEAEAERAKIEAGKEKESERMKFEAEAERAKIEAEKEKESERMKIEAEAQKESERMKLEAEKESESRRQEFELRKLEMEHDLRMREVQVNVEQNGSGEGGMPRSNRGHSVAMKALKLPLFNDEKDDLDAYLSGLRGHAVR